MKIENNPDLRASWRAILQNMEKTQQAGFFKLPAVQLIAVSKGQPRPLIDQLLADGQRLFGENRIQEALDKWPSLRARYPDTELHLIGGLQTNKTKEALALFDVIETIDRTELVDAIAKEILKDASGSLRCKRFFIQVNIGEELQKSGVAPAATKSLLDYCQQKNIFVEGLMCIPPAGSPPAPYFALLHKMAKEYGLLHLSMGMSGDYETAIRLGATHVRIGTALFGERS